MNLTSANEHVPDIEHLIRFVKETKIAARHIIPFNNIPKLLDIYIVFAFFRMLNYFPVKGGVSSILILKTIMSGETPHNKQHLGINIGQ